MANTNEKKPLWEKAFGEIPSTSDQIVSIVYLLSIIPSLFLTMLSIMGLDHVKPEDEPIVRTMALTIWPYPIYLILMLVVSYRVSRFLHFKPIYYILPILPALLIVYVLYVCFS